MIIHGKWYPPESSAQSVATLSITGDDYSLEIENQRLRAGRLEDISVSDRVGNIERKLVLSDGSVFATDNNDDIDKTFGDRNIIASIIHTVESHTGWVVTALVFTLLFSFSFFKWGVPWVGTTIAHALPQKTNELIATHTLDFLDKSMFKESELSVERQAAISNHFQSTVLPLESLQQDIPFKLHFRKWQVGKESVSNALALPSGDIILTDAFVELSKNQAEIDSVLLHEMGHVVKRHGLEMIIESMLVTTAVVLVVGDASGITDLGAGLGALLVSANYSQSNETESDIYALDLMLKANMDPIAFANILSRMMEREAPSGDSEVVDESKEADSNDENKDDNDKSLLDYLSSHPATAERIARAQRYSQCFRQQQTDCSMSER